MNFENKVVRIVSATSLLVNLFVFFVVVLYEPWRRGLFPGASSSKLMLKTEIL